MAEKIQPKLEVCTIRVMFPVQSDEHAIDCKKKVTAIFSEVPEAQIHFSITNAILPPNFKA